MARGLALCTVLSALGLLPWLTLGQAPGELDVSFEPEVFRFGPGSTVNSIVPLPDGKILVGGLILDASQNTSGLLWLNDNGSLDTRLGYKAVDAAVFEALLQPDGKLLVAGAFTHLHGAQKRYLARLHPDASLDQTFSAPSITSVVLSIAFQGSKILVARRGASVVRLNANGDLDASFDAAGAAADLIRVQPDGKLLKTGPRFELVRWLDYGRSIDPEFTGPAPNGAIRAILLQNDGRAIIGGDFTQLNGTAFAGVARLAANGVIDPSFTSAPGPNGPVQCMAIEAADRILVGGAFSTFQGAPRNGLARLAPDGTLDNFDPGSGTRALVKTIAVQKDGRILIGGQFDRFQGATRNGLARLHGGQEKSRPLIWVQPMTESVFEGKAAKLEIRATSAKVTYQWQFNGQDIPGAVQATLSLTNVQRGAAGEYRALVSNSAGVTASQTAILTVVPFEPLKEWTWRRGPSPAALEHLRAVAFGQNTFVAVGDRGTILTSPDGANWSPHPSPTAAQLADVCYGNGGFVAVGRQGVILTSTNGLDWQARSSDTAIDLSGVKPKDGGFIAVGGFGSFSSDSRVFIILTSPDGTQWKTAQEGPWGNLLDIAHGRGVSIGVGSLETKPFPLSGWVAHVAHSSNEIAWDRFPVSIAPTTYHRIEFGNDRFVTITSLGVVATLTNVTQVNAWAQWSAGLENVFSGLSFGHGIFLILSKGAIFASANGLTWTRQPTGNPAMLMDGVFANHTFVAVGENGTVLQSGIFSDRTAIRVANAALAKGRFQISVQTENGREYVLEFKNALEEPTWTPLSPVTGNGSTVQLSDTNTLIRQRFYRVRLR